jgi:S-adenosylmethionine decarboxylase proenzyme
MPALLEELSVLQVGSSESIGEDDSHTAGFGDTRIPPMSTSEMSKRSDSLRVLSTAEGDGPSLASGTSFPSRTVFRHLICDLYNCRPDRLSDVEPVRELLLEAARIIGATTVAQAFHRFEPQGVTGTVVLAESHISVHTWPESRYVALDIASCGEMDPRLGFRHLREAFGASDARVQEILRGVPEELELLDNMARNGVRIFTEIAVRA